MSRQSTYNSVRRWATDVDLHRGVSRSSSPGISFAWLGHQKSPKDLPAVKVARLVVTLPSGTEQWTRIIGCSFFSLGRFFKMRQTFPCDIATLSNGCRYFHREHAGGDSLRSHARTAKPSALAAARASARAAVQMPSPPSPRRVRQRTPSRRRWSDVTVHAERTRTVPCAGTGRRAEVILTVGMHRVSGRRPSGATMPARGLAHQSRFPAGRPDNRPFPPPQPSPWKPPSRRRSPATGLPFLRRRGALPVPQERRGPR